MSEGKTTKGTKTTKVFLRPLSLFVPFVFFVVLSPH